MPTESDKVLAAKLDALADKLELYTAGVQERCRHIDDKLGKMNDTLSDAKNGLVVRVDRIEQREISRSRWHWAFITTSIAVLVGLIKELFFGK